MLVTVGCSKDEMGPCKYNRYIRARRIKGCQWVSELMRLTMPVVPPVLWVHLSGLRDAHTAGKTLLLGVSVDGVSRRDEHLNQ